MRVSRAEKEELGIGYYHVSRAGRVAEFDGQACAEINISYRRSSLLPASLMSALTPAATGKVTSTASREPPHIIEHTAYPADAVYRAIYGRIIMTACRRRRDKQDTYIAVS